jgi:Flp pilus assembly protein TadD/SAM-dependent methyltransferase
MVGKIAAVVSDVGTIARRFCPPYGWSEAESIPGVGEMERSVTGAAFGRPSADQLFEQAVAHHNAGRLGEAERLYRDSLALDPHHADSLNCLGILAQQCGRGETALDLIGRALAINEREPQYHYNLALVLASLGRLDEAIAHNRRAVALKPDHADAHSNLAAALAGRGQWSEAELHFRRALARRPQWPPAYSNLAGALRAQARSAEALEVAARGLAVEATDDLKAIFCLCVRDLAAPPKVDKLRGLLERAIDECWMRPSELAPLATALVKENAAVRSAVEKAAARPAAAGAAGRAGRLTAGELFLLAGEGLLQRLLVSAPVCDPALEQLLAAARSALLALASGGAAAVSEDVLSFCCALAQQCFINEYVFIADDEESGRAQALREALAGGLEAGEDISALWLAAVGSYLPLHSVPGAQLLLERSWAEPVERLLAQQVREPMREEELRASIPVLTTIDDPSSERVRQQCEQNPYPRWVKGAALAKPLAFDDYLRLQLPQTPARPLGKAEVDMLIAGCGTGQHAVETARCCLGARILAVDLSLASLAYARRKTAEAGFTNIDYAQADILRLEGAPRFDVVEAVGTLHHLADPFGGWRLLLALLRPGGFMRVGLYRASARRDIDAARAFIAERGYRSTADDIRRARQAIVALDAASPARAVLRYSDFFTTGECRDLLFHVRDRPVTIAEIKAFVLENGLAFLGFENAGFNRYAGRYPGDPGMTDIDNWQRLEQEDPQAFSGMYQLWVQKPASA